MPRPLDVKNTAAVIIGAVVPSECVRQREVKKLTPATLTSGANALQEINHPAMFGDSFVRQPDVDTSFIACLTRQ